MQTSDRIIVPEINMKWLGIWLDRTASFKHHIQAAAAKAQLAWNLAQRLTRKNGGGMSPPALRHLINSCILPIMDYGSAVWYNGNPSQVSTCQRLQNTMIRRMTGSAINTPVAVLGHDARIPPVQICLEEAMIREATRWAGLPPSHPIIWLLREETGVQTRLHRVKD
jgi:hypothetical protein